MVGAARVAGRVSAALSVKRRALRDSIVVLVMVNLKLMSRSSAVKLLCQCQNDFAFEGSRLQGGGHYPLLICLPLSPLGPPSRPSHHRLPPQDSEHQRCVTTRYVSSHLYQSPAHHFRTNTGSRTITRRSPRPRWIGPPTEPRPPGEPQDQPTTPPQTTKNDLQPQSALAVSPLKTSSPTHHQAGWAQRASGNIPQRAND